ncbi:MAG: hypothetical protein FJ090_20935, partial [Deltaproteobacteria bacterium]|nr:hypothetical protein [Deltaproteobacteria bacterium]
PLFGAGTPPLDTGASLWLVAAPDRAALTAHLARAVADRRPVLVQAPADLVLDAAARGPLFRASFSKPEELHDAAYDLETPHPALALVIAVPEGEKASEWAREVSEDFPVLLVVARGKGGAGSADGGTTAVDCAREGDAWSFQPQPK